MKHIISAVVISLGLYGCSCDPDPVITQEAPVPQSGQTPVVIQQGGHDGLSVGDAMIIGGAAGYLGSKMGQSSSHTTVIEKERKVYVQPSKPRSSWFSSSKSSSSSSAPSRSYSRSSGSRSYSRGSRR